MCSIHVKERTAARIACMLAAILAAPGCSDDTNPRAADKGVAQDSGPGKDSGGGPDAATLATVQSAFGVFAAFTEEFADFRINMGQSIDQYYAWAGEQMQELSANWTRSNLQLIWDLIEPEIGQGYDWTGSLGGESCFAAAHQAGVHYLAVFHQGESGQPAPGGKPGLRNPMDDVSSYTRFVRDVVERFDGDGVDDNPHGIVIKHWQVGNEIMEWTLSGRTPLQYADWFSTVASVIRQADPQAKLVLIASTDSSTVDPFLRQVITLLAQRQGTTFDAIDLHHWGLASIEASQMTAVPEYLALLSQNGYSQAELWSCEHGTHIGQPAEAELTCDPPCPEGTVCGGPFCAPRCTTDADCPPARSSCDQATGRCLTPAQTAHDQARSLVYRFVMNRALGVRRILWNNLASWHCFQGSCGHLFDLMGLVANGFGPGETAASAGDKRPSYFAYAMLAERTDELYAEQLGRVDLGQEDVYVYGYRHRGTQATGYVAWAAQSATVTLELTGSEAKVTGLIAALDGTPLRDQTLTIQSGAVTVPLSPDPVWIATTTAW